MKRVATSIITELSDEFLRWGSKDDVRARCAMHETQYGIPRVAGFLDGTHIPVRVTNGFEHEHAINRKGFASTVLQACCDSNLTFLDATAGGYGCNNDAFVFRGSGLRRKIEENREEVLPDGAVIFGDSIYPLTSYLVKAFPSEPSMAIKLFNFQLSSMRQAIESAFGRLKALFAILACQRSYGPEMTGTIAIVCCTLANVHANIDRATGSESFRPVMLRRFRELEQTSAAINGGEGGAAESVDVQAPGVGGQAGVADTELNAGRRVRWTLMRGVALRRRDSDPTFPVPGQSVAM